MRLELKTKHKCNKICKTKGRGETRALFENSDDSDVSDADCFCGECFFKSKDNEGWICCTNCIEWAHEECVHCEEVDDDYKLGFKP